jgi:RNA polymerase sigma-70 factor (ECF subfamily)
VEAGDASSQSAERALADLCRSYWPPVYTFVRRRGHPASDAQDLTQAFFAHLLEKRVYAQADPSRGRFRSFLLTALKNFLVDTHARAQTGKRGGSYEFLPLNEAVLAAESAAFVARETQSGVGRPDREDRLFEERWAAALVSRSLESLRDEYVTENRETLFDALRPFLGGGAAPVPNQDELATRLGLPVNTLRTHIHRLRERYRSTLRAEVAHTVATEGEVREELRHLMRVLVDSQ